MSASIDALAMAGVDYRDVAIDFNSIDDHIPPYLLAKNYEESLQLSAQSHKRSKSNRKCAKNYERSELDGKGSDGGSVYCELKGNDETMKEN